MLVIWSEEDVLPVVQETLVFERGIRAKGQLGKHPCSHSEEGEWQIKEVMVRPWETCQRTPLRVSPSGSSTDLRLVRLERPTADGLHKDSS